ncbi:conserved protein of unknown function [Streptomyces sp. KY75]|nr:hypothetical protein STIB_24330 [Streptomyces sp. IB2014 011-1]CAD5923091.1 conserved protein of unknown function [Streptomyces sp. KY70]CAD5990847.1 conserved protein of unknown function [Streptomyces sp. KY75]
MSRWGYEWTRAREIRAARFELDWRRRGYSFRSAFTEERSGGFRTTSLCRFCKALGGMEGVGRYRFAECQNSDSFRPSFGARPAGS